MAEAKEPEAGTALATAPRMIEPTPELVELAYRAVMDGEKPPEVGDPSITARAIQERIRQADTFEEVFGSQDLDKFSNYVGEEVVIGGFHLNPSAFEQGSAVYAVVEIARQGSGEFFPVSIGGGNVLVQLLKAWEQGWFPFAAKLIEKDTATPGRSTFYLEATNARR